jgi:hypothetical protein
MGCRACMRCYRAAGATTRCVIVPPLVSATLLHACLREMQSDHLGNKGINSKRKGRDPPTLFGLRLYPFPLRSSVHMSVGPWPLSKDGTKQYSSSVFPLYPATHHNTSHAPSNAHESLPSTSPPASCYLELAKGGFVLRQSQNGGTWLLWSFNDMRTNIATTYQPALRQY